MNIAIILASGAGKRMGAGKNKTLLPLRGRPLICRTFQNFEKSKEIGGVILVVNKEGLDVFKDIVEKYNFTKIIKVIVGAEERQYSAEKGIDFADKNIKDKGDLIVVFHNGANPFVTPQEIDLSIREACKCGACAVAHKTKDTIREVDQEGMSLGVIDRSKLWNMQTPQTIKFNLAKKAFQQARKDNFLGTDDVSLVERLKKPVKIVEASENNFKITTPKDLKLAELIAKSPDKVNLNPLEASSCLRKRINK